MALTVSAPRGERSVVDPGSAGRGTVASASGRGTRDGGRWARAVVRHARGAAAAALGGMAAHLAMIANGGWMAALAVAMAAACGPCAWAMWRRPTVRVARMLVAMSLGMALFHAAFALIAAPPSGHAHAQVASNAASAASEHAGHLAPVLVVVAADFAAALLGASWLRRVGPASGSRPSGAG